MSQNETKNLSARESFEERVLAEFAHIRGAIKGFDVRLERVEDRLTTVEDRLTTVEERLTTLEERLMAVETRLDIIDQRLLALDHRVITVDKRLTTLEERVDTRLTETRPIWEAIQASIMRLEEKFDTVAQELFEMRHDMRLHRNMLNAHERRLNP